MNSSANACFAAQLSLSQLSAAHLSIFMGCCAYNPRSLRWGEDFERQHWNYLAHSTLVSSPTNHRGHTSLPTSSRNWFKLTAVIRSRFCIDSRPVISFDPDSMILQLKKEEKKKKDVTWFQARDWFSMYNDYDQKCWHCSSLCQPEWASCSDVWHEKHMKRR